MNCDEAQKLLSPFYDGQLDDKTRSRMADHMEQCRDCPIALQGYVELSGLARWSETLQVPPGLWEKMDRQLEQGRVVVPPSDLPPTPRRFTVRTLLSVAVLLLLAGVGVTLLPQAGHDHDELAVDFDHYLEAFLEDPDKAAEVLFADYPAEEVDVETATKRVGYRPVVADELPEGYVIDSMHIMKMPCCTCIKTVCRNNKGAPFVVFEHDSEQPLWFGDRQKRDCDCGGVATSVVEFGEQIAATWQVGKRSVTVVGVRDVDEITRLMPYLGRDPAEG